MTEPKYRYFLVPPSTIPLPLGEIVPSLPHGAWSGTERDKQRTIQLPASEALATNIPRIRFARLRELVPDCIREPADAPEWIALPPVPLVLAYRPGVRREAIPDEPTPPASEPAGEKPAAPSPDAAPASGQKPEPPSAEIKPGEEKPVESTAPAQDGEPPAPKPIPAWKRLLKPKLAPPPPSAKDESPTPPADKPATPVPIVSRTPVADDEPKLRALFMTDDDLTVGGLVDLCAKLPGITGCELLDDSGLLCSASMPDKLKPTDWIAPAREALARMQGIPSDMPSITLHPPSAAVSMWLPAKFSFVVVHDERGFRPGVLEKIDATVAAIVRAIG
jgi:hypothetical protein